MNDEQTAFRFLICSGMLCLAAVVLTIVGLTAHAAVAGPAFWVSLVSAICALILHVVVKIDEFRILLRLVLAASLICMALTFGAI